jgi:hypothetical protein
MQPPRKLFSGPWCLVEHEESFEVADAGGEALAFVYFENEPGRRASMKRMSKEDARR